MRSETGSDTSTLLSAALSAASRGWAVFPLRPGDKRPAVRDWENRATTDRARIERCWHAGPYGIGIATGPSALVVVDLDTPKEGESPPLEWTLPGVVDGADVLAVLAERRENRLPLGTYVVRTGSGGMHLYFRAPERAALRNSTGRLGWMVDTRAAGGYVVAAGSTVGGCPYTVVHDTEVAVLPGWLAWLLQQPQRDSEAERTDLTRVRDRISRMAGYGGAALRNQVQHVLDARPGTRNSTLNEAAFALGRLVGAGVIPRDLTEDALARAGEATGLGARECVATIRSGLDAGAARPSRGTA